MNLPTPGCGEDAYELDILVFGVLYEAVDIARDPPLGFEHLLAVEDSPLKKLSIIVCLGQIKQSAPADIRPLPQ